MQEQEQKELLDKVHKFHEEDSFVAIIELLEPRLSELNYDLGLELARAYINAGMKANESNDEFFEGANALLDRYSLEGKDHATYLFYKGFALFKLGLINDAVIRFERASRFVNMITESSLLSKINNMLQLCKTYDPDNLSMALDKQDEDILDAHIKQYFGSYRILFKTDRYEILDIAPSAEHPYHLIITKGLSGKKINVPAGVDPLSNSRIELCLCLPSEWEFTNSEGYNIWPINALCNLINYILTTDEFIGFGYTFSEGKPIHSSVKFTGGMLVAPGAYPRAAYDLTLSDNSIVRVFELIFLYPMEIAFRENHQAYELLERFEQKGIMPSPVRFREDVCAQVGAFQKI